MMNWSDKHSVRADRWYAPLAVFLLIYPVLTVLKQGSASALLIAAGVLSLGDAYWLAMRTFGDAG